MKQEKLQVGTTEHKHTVTLRIPESDEDMKVLSHGSLTVRLRYFIRAWRIENQEKSGARAYVRELGDAAEDKALQAIIDGFDATTVRERVKAGPRPPIKLTAAELKACGNDPVKLAALMAAKGVTIEVE